VVSYDGRRFLVGLALVGLAAAASPRKVLVLEANGPPCQLISQKSAPVVITGSILQERDTVEVKAGSSLTVMVLGKKERLRVLGPGKVTIGPEGLQEAGVKLEKLEAPDSSLALSGDSHRRLAGLRTRAQGSLPEGSQFDQVQVSGGQLTLESGRLSNQPVRVYFYAGYRGPIIDAKGIEREDPEQLLQSLEVSPAAGGSGGVRYQVALPSSPGDLTLRVTGGDARELLFTRLRNLTTAEQSELDAALQSLRQWSSQTAQSAEPWLLQAYLLEEKGQVRPALASLERALALRPGDPGLWESKLRLLLDCGEYAQATKLYGERKP